MKINHIKLKNYRRFKMSKIKDFEATFSKPSVVITGSNGRGKGGPLDDVVKIPGGWKKYGDLQIGDTVTAWDGTPTKITHIFPLGEQQLYRVTLVDGRYADVTRDHLWTIHFFNAKKNSAKDTKVVTTIELLRHLNGSHPHNLAYIPAVISEQCTPPVDLPIHPYTLGALLGDGSLSKHCVALSTDEWICRKIQDLSPTNITMTIGPCTSSDKIVVGRFRRDKDGLANTIRDEIINLGLIGHRAWEKFIPKIYLDAPHEDRLHLLQGLIDTDGFVSNPKKQIGRNGLPSKCGGIEYSTTSLQLAKDIQYLVRSLGGQCKLKERQTFYSYNGQTHLPGRISYRLNIRHPYPSSLASLPRKRDRLADNNQYSESFKMRVLSVVPLPEKKECLCIKIEHPDELYVAKDFIVTHNSSLLQMLNPLPPVRSDFDMGGLKELHIEHEGHNFVLTSDFSSKTSPHSFMLDGVELNSGNTTEVQQELVEKYFGITPVVNRLIYGKIKLCDTTKAERKNLFLHINPMELGLILDTHKKAVTQSKSCKANLQHLYTRKQDLEGKMLPQEVLQQNIRTKERLSQQLLDIDKVIYALEQHTNNLYHKFNLDLDHKESCIRNNIPIIPRDAIFTACRSIEERLSSFVTIPTGEEFNEKKAELKIRKHNLSIQHTELSRIVGNLSKEINEYTKHLENSNGSRPISAVEDELKKVQEELKKYTDLPKEPIPLSAVPYCKNVLEKIRELLFIFVDKEVSLIPIKELQDKVKSSEIIGNNLNTLNLRISQVKSTLEDLDKEIFAQKSKASIPAECTSSACGLRVVFASRAKTLLERKEKEEALLQELTKEHTELSKTSDELVKFLQPYLFPHDLISAFEDLRNYLNDSYFRIKDWNSTLVDTLNLHPMSILEELSALIHGSEIYVEYLKLSETEKRLNTELEVLSKNSGTSLEFLQGKLKEKEIELATQLSKLKDTDKDIESVDNEYNLYLEYSSACETIENYTDKFNQGERAILVSRAVNYWTKLKDLCEQVKLKLSSELWELDKLVRDQETIHKVYEEEIVSWIDKISKDKLVYDKIELALSPTTGIPHRSMVKYLNTLINNVNYFIQQVWSYHMKIRPIVEDQPLDYGFPIELNTASSNDISFISDGQREIVNLSWVLTILLQMKLLDKTPFFADELGRCMDKTHQQNLLKFMNTLVDNHIVNQLFMVSHQAAISGGFTDFDCICLSPDDSTDLPGDTNVNVRFVYD